MSGCGLSHKSAEDGCKPGAVGRSSEHQNPREKNP